MDSLLIFDCDGVLVDSEPIAMALLIETIAKQGLAITPPEAHARFLGKSLATMCNILAESYGVALSGEALEQMRLRLYDRFRRELKPVPRICEALDAIDMPRCVASSSQLERIRLALDVTGLRSRFEPHLFSASMVKEGKPAPDLFLHAASAMGVDPQACIVIEDSPAGVQAAKRAGMRAFAFTGGSHASAAGLAGLLEEAEPTLIFDDMTQLPDLLRQEAASLGLT
ncbi:haloacid dehalogenase superfamily, subfamily IA, variant 3 with third motif having DD or ED [Rhizobiales bacterium GAS113]|nr:haloacid dehalogenase superfamily, subfamily IA, variant 3 with third motif having DD or ED [Rhizobiales bacterium GAS113]